MNNINMKEIRKIEWKDLPTTLKQVKPKINRLFFHGNIDLLYKESFSIVGTRHPTEYGIRWGTYFSKELTLRSIVITSGLAIGIDRCAHETCLKYGGRTIGVLGTGFNNLYPKANIDLMNEIIDHNGLIITEYESNVGYNKKNFLLRNRIISGISSGVIVIEATSRSGSCITAKYARKQDKEVFAVPGRIGDVHSNGTNRLIKQGAHLVENISDIEKIIPSVKVAEQIDVKNDYKKIYEYFLKNEYTIEELVEYNDLDYEETIEKITCMEIEGILENNNGVYRLII